MEIDLSWLTSNPILLWVVLTHLVYFVYKIIKALIQKNWEEVKPAEKKRGTYDPYNQLRIPEELKPETLKNDSLSCKIKEAQEEEKMEEDNEDEEDSDEDEESEAPEKECTFQIDWSEAEGGGFFWSCALTNPENQETPVCDKNKCPFWKNKENNGI